MTFHKYAAANLSASRNEINTCVELNDANTLERNKISKLRECVPQILAVSAKNVLLLTFGCSVGFITILIGALDVKDSEIKVTKEDISWISSIYLFMTPLGCLASGPVSKFVGVKRTMLMANIPFVAGWLIFYFSTTPSHIFGALGICGLTGGLCEAPVLTYVGEVTQPYLRGILAAVSSISVMIGIVFQFFCGSLMNWRSVALVNITFPILTFLSLLMVPESPYWLAGHKREKEAEKALCWLRGWSTPAHVREEYQTVLQSVQRPMEKNSLWKAYTKRTFIHPLLLISFAFFVSVFGGSSNLQVYAVRIFETVYSPIKVKTATIFLGLAEMIGTVVFAVVIYFVGKRKITFASVVGTGISFLSCALHGFLKPGEYTWIPMTCLIGAGFFSHAGIRHLPWILCGEVFPANIRNNATGAAGCFAYILSSIINKIFLYMVDAIEMRGTFFFYAIINFIGIVGLYFWLPETEGRTLLEIENHFAGVNNLKNKPKNHHQLNITCNLNYNNDKCESKL